MTTKQDTKIADLQKDTVQLNGTQPMATDYGIKISNTDNWLRTVDGSTTGPSLLEDQIAREKVCSPFFCFVVTGILIKGYR